MKISSCEACRVSVICITVMALALAVQADGIKLRLADLEARASQHDVQCAWAEAAAERVHAWDSPKSAANESGKRSGGKTANR